MRGSGDLLAKCSAYALASLVTWASVNGRKTVLSPTNAAKPNNVKNITLTSKPGQHARIYCHVKGIYIATTHRPQRSGHDTLTERELDDYRACTLVSGTNALLGPCRDFFLTTGQGAWIAAMVCRLYPHSGAWPLAFLPIMIWSKRMLNLCLGRKRPPWRCPPGVSTETPRIDAYKADTLLPVGREQTNLRRAFLTAAATPRTRRGSTSFWPNGRAK